MKKHKGYNDIVIDLDYIKKAILFNDNVHEKVSEDMAYLLCAIKQTILDNPIKEKDIWLITTNMIENTFNYPNKRIIKMSTTREQAIKYLYEDESRIEKKSWEVLINEWYDKNE